MRAFGGLMALALIIFALYLVISRKLHIRALIAAGVIGLSITYNQVVSYATQAWEKQLHYYHYTPRLDELYAVFGAISETPLTLLFGIGWGGLVHNPILTELTRFTHSLISFWLLKTGVIGFAVMMLFVTLLLRQINLKNIWVSSHRLAVLLAAAAIIIIGLLFETTYKTLSFGLIVGLLLAELSSTSGPPQKQMPNNSLLQPHADKL
jgi:multisubunit Na+/H+ antiporter MnhC subunit